MSFEFTLVKTIGAARAGRFTTPHGVVHSPAFMAVGTLATVKALDPDDLRAMDAQMILANAYHLHLRPGDELVRELGSPATVAIPKRPGEPDCTWADIAKIRRDLGWEPKVCFAEGVGIMRENIEHWRDAPVWTAARIADATADWFRFLGQASAGTTTGSGVDGHQRRFVDAVELGRTGNAT